MSALPVSPAATPALLQVEKVSVSFGGVNAVTDISFEVHEGEILSIIGPNGAGKSSLLNVINGVYRASGGRVVVGGRGYTRLRPEQAARLGMARSFQNLALFKGMSVIDNVLTGRTLRMRRSFLAHALRSPGARAEEAEQRRRAEAALEFLHIQSHRDTPVGQLSYGLQKRVELARALAAEPRLLLLDEPMAGMNSHEKHELARLVVEVNRRLGTTIVLIEHDMGVVMDISDRVVVLDHGRKIADGPPAQVRCQPEVIAAYLGAAH
ncbi:ABC transporter ATP-binding protein [Aquabacterium sp. A7-Y]|uniref:ABC transporter ATP-binding protein n=1 Tax=Aquabacterium sp. A7-Y TaxID=1349605 RepID=UPI00223D46A3|nr:ABC transporter ATP-binding protein [Aquabacterium sp. A7-Y]MCW7540160.1 ABC transporter ATP-binding protein [Aquabacterium sp. A7-Y]